MDGLLEVVGRVAVLAAMVFGIAILLKGCVWGRYVHGGDLSRSARRPTMPKKLIGLLLDNLGRLTHIPLIWR